MAIKSKTFCFLLLFLVNQVKNSTQNNLKKQTLISQFLCFLFCQIVNFVKLSTKTDLYFVCDNTKLKDNLVRPIRSFTVLTRYSERTP